MLKLHSMDVQVVSVFFNQFLHSVTRISRVISFFENPFDGCEVFDCIIVVVLFT